MTCQNEMNTVICVFLIREEYLAVSPNTKQNAVSAFVVSVAIQWFSYFSWQRLTK
jgi:hypothetical protein